MKNILTLIITLFLAYTAQAQQPQIALQHNGSSTFYTSATTAMTAAQNGDTLYFPGGSFGNLDIDKQLVIYGTGIHPDSTGATGVSSFGTIYFKGNTDGSKLQGVNVQYLRFQHSAGNIIKNIQVKKCQIDGYYRAPTPGYSSQQSPAILFASADTIRDILIEESIIGDYTITGNSNYANANFKSIRYYNSSIDSIYNIVFRKNIIRRELDEASFSQFYNNIFLQASFTNVTDCFFISNYFANGVTVTNSSYLNNCIFNNNGNVIANFSNNYNFGINNTGSLTIANHFVNVGSTSDFSFSYDYHLKSSSLGINAGFDGTDIGIYGTVVPTQEGWVPDNPQIIFKSIGNMPDANGNLPVQVQARAVDNQ